MAERKDELIERARHLVKHSPKELGGRGAIDIIAKLLSRIDHLRAVERAAHAYYTGYCQDEADEEGICGLEQQTSARALRDALRAAD